MTSIPAISQEFVLAQNFVSNLFIHLFTCFFLHSESEGSVEAYPDFHRGKAALHPGHIYQ